MRFCFDKRTNLCAFLHTWGASIKQLGNTLFFINENDRCQRVRDITLGEISVGMIECMDYAGAQACSSNICMQELESHSTYQMRTVDEAKKIFPPGDPIDDDLFNQFAFVVDMDEIGFSPDFVKRLTGNTPILRQVW